MHICFFHYRRIEWTKVVFWGKMKQNQPKFHEPWRACHPKNGWSQLYLGIFHSGWWLLLWILTHRWTGSRKEWRWAQPFGGVVSPKTRTHGPDISNWPAESPLKILGTGNDAAKPRQRGRSMDNVYIKIMASNRQYNYTIKIAERQ